MGREATHLLLVLELLVLAEDALEEVVDARADLLHAVALAEAVVGPRRAEAAARGGPKHRRGQRLDAVPEVLVDGQVAEGAVERLGRRVRVHVVHLQGQAGEGSGR